MIKQNTYERKNRKKTIPEALITSLEKEIKKNYTKMERFGTRLKNRTTNGKPCQFCNAPNWNPTHKCPTMDKLCNKCGKKGHFARVCRLKEIYRRKVQNVTGETTAIGGESGES